MFTKKFFKLFPPPKFLNAPYAGLDISDDAVHCIEYSKGMNGLVLHRYGALKLEPGIVESGYIKNEAELIKVLTPFVKELKIHTVKASLPEERMYLFKTDVPSIDERQIRQNIEFKLEENVPLSPSEALFFFDIIPNTKDADKIYVSVSVAPRDLVDSYLKVIRATGLDVVSFEIQPKAIARAVIPYNSSEVQIIVYCMSDKMGIYIVNAGVVSFTSTITIDSNFDTSILQNELKKVYLYWKERGEGKVINRIIITGKNAVKISDDSKISPNPSIPVEIAHVWQNAFSSDHYIPPVSFDDSLEYVIAAGLALP
jgi:Tfp pilus assembly PilM family ATPase